MRACFKKCIHVTGYVFGIVATFVSLNLMRLGQPALLFLVPSVLLPVIVTALLSRELCVFLTGRPFVGSCFPTHPRYSSVM